MFYKRKICIQSFLSFPQFRNFCLQNVTNNVIRKEDLSKLRKISGFTFSKCKEALLKFDSNIEEAHNWLKEESVKHGWAKMGKLADRPMSNGLLGFQKNRNSGILLELNCETDFVARNHNFQVLLDQVATVGLEYYDTLVTDRSQLEQLRMNLDVGVISQMKLPGQNMSLEDSIAVTVGTVGENIKINRCVCIGCRTSQQFVESYMHSPWPDLSKCSEGNTEFGRYAAVVRYQAKNTSIEPNEEWIENSKRVMRGICQHIVGMSPKKLGKLSDTPTSEDPDKEESLVLQKYILDETINVGQIMEQNELLIRDFVRFGLGETISNVV